MSCVALTQGQSKGCSIAAAATGCQLEGKRPEGTHFGGGGGGGGGRGREGACSQEVAVVPEELLVVLEHVACGGPHVVAVDLARTAIDGGGGGGDAGRE